MACFSGKEGVISVGAVNVAQMTNYTINETSDTVECSHMDQTDGFKEYAPGMRSWSGSIDLVWNEQDGVTGLQVGAAAVAMIAYPTGSGDNLAGDILITSMDISGGVDGNVSASLSFQGTGSLDRNYT